MLDPRLSGPILLNSLKEIFDFALLRSLDAVFRLLDLRRSIRFIEYLRFLWVVSCFDDVHREDLNVNAMDGKRIHGGDYYVEFTEGLEREMTSPSYFTYFAACFINLCFSSQR